MRTKHETKMPLQKFWRRLFHPEVEFQVLKSHSAVELTCYSTAVSSASVPILSNRRKSGQTHQKSRKNLASSRSSSVGRPRPMQLNPIPRYYSHYESFGFSPPVAQIGLLDGEIAVSFKDSHGDCTDVFKNSATFTTLSPPLNVQQQRTCVVFCFIESKANHGCVLSSKSIGPDELAAALLAEDEKPSGQSSDETLRVALSLCQQYRENDRFKEGVLLKTVESESIHTYISYASFVISEGQDRLDVARQLSKLNRKSAQDLKYRQQQGAYEELYSIVRKPEPFDSRLPSSQNAGHIVIGYKLLSLDNLEQLESTWMHWSGASEIVRYAPPQWSMKRITFHRQIFTLQDSSGGWLPAPDGFMYILLCEFENLMQPGHVVMGCDLVERLRVRNCGHVGIYKIQWTYASHTARRDHTGAPTVEAVLSSVQKEDENLRQTTANEDEFCNCKKDETKGDTLLQLFPAESDQSAENENKR